MAIIVNGDGILTGVSSLATALTDITSGRGTVTGVATVGTLQLGAGVSMSSPRSQNAAIFTNNTEFFTVDDAGRVGVGTITPNSDAHPENEKKINVGFITARSVAGDIDANTMVVAGISTFVGNVNLGDGTKLGIGGSPDVDLHIKSAAPTIRFTDTDTNRFSQIYAVDGNLRLDADNNNAQADTNISFRTDGTERLKVDSTGDTIVSGTLFADSDLFVVDQIRHTGDTNTAIRFPAADTVSVETAGSEGLRINNSGQVLINKTTNRDQYYGGSYTGQLQVEGTGNSTRLTQFIHNTNAASQPIVVLGKSRGTSVGSYTVVQNSDYLGTLSFQGADGDAMIEGARIDAIVDGTPGNNDMPGRLMFGTTADGASSTTERMRIDSNGTLFSFSPNDTTPNIKWRSDDTNWFGSLNQSVEGATISTFLSTGGDWSANGTTYSATKALANFETRAIALHPQFNNGAGKVAFLQKAAGSSTTDGTVTEILKIDNDGIKFGSDTAAANALDDYEEGSWTPAFGNVNAPTYGTQYGRYCKIGSQVTLTGQISVDSGLDTSDGSTVNIGGLPFGGNSAAEACLFTFGRYTNLIPESKLDDFTNVRFGGTFVMLLEGNNADISYAELNSSGTIQFAISYIINT